MEPYEFPSHVQEYNSQAYYCSCNSGYSGVSCSTKIAAVTSPTSSSSGTYTCPVPCNHGECLQHYNTEAYYCQCSSGYSGVSCSSPLSSAGGSPTSSSTCCASCKYDNCKLIDNSKNVCYCDCRSGYFGCDCSSLTGGPALLDFTGCHVQL